MRYILDYRIHTISTPLTENVNNGTERANSCFLKNHSTSQKNETKKRSNNLSFVYLAIKNEKLQKNPAINT